jgi:hypothetical protein
MLNNEIDVRRFLAEECNIKNGAQMIPGHAAWPKAEQMIDYLAPKIEALIKQAEEEAYKKGYTNGFRDSESGVPDEL